MILRDSLKLKSNVEQISSNVKETADKPKISVPVILQEVECVTNASIENIKSEDIKIWVPKSMQL